MGTYALQILTLHDVGEHSRTPRADWIFLIKWGHAIEEIANFSFSWWQVHVQSDPAGRLVITGDPEQPDNPWGITPFKKVVGWQLHYQKHICEFSLTCSDFFYLRWSTCHQESILTKHPLLSRFMVSCLCVHHLGHPDM
jgi:hypothetical protein